MKIRIFSDCKYTDSQKAKDIYISIYGRDPGYLVADDSYTHAILINKASPVLNIPASHVVGLAFEPIDFLRLNPSYIQYAKQHVGRYLIGTDIGIDGFEQHYSYLWHTIPLHTVPNVLPKPRKMSMMLSRKRFMPGHRYRYELAREILRNKLDVDIWGNGADQLIREFGQLPQIKGGFRSHESLLKDYVYNLAIENTRHPAYFSEKLLDPLVYRTIPVYLGCTALDQWFGNTSPCLHLTGNISEDIAYIKKLLSQPTPEFPFNQIQHDMMHSPKLNLFVAIEQGKFFPIDRK
jgi:hypothetical protein